MQVRYTWIFLAIIIFFGACSTQIHENPYKEKAEQNIAKMKEYNLCGSYEIVGTAKIIDKFTFGDGNRVKKRIIYGFKTFPGTYYISGNEVLIYIGKDQSRLLIDGNQLIGKDKWTKDHVYRKSEGENATCQVIEPDDEYITSLANRLCYVDGMRLQSQSDFFGAQSKYLECCTAGDAVSCNKYGFLADGVFNNSQTASRYYRMACDMGYGVGCSNLANLADREGKNEQSYQLEQEACQKGYQESCGKVELMDQTKGYYEHGLAYFRQKKYKTALQSFKKALVFQKSVKKDRIHSSMGLTYSRLRQYSNAIKSYSKAISTSSDEHIRFNHYIDRAAVYSQSRRFNSAVKDYTKALKIHPNVFAYRNRALAYFYLGKFDKCIDDNNRAIELKPDYAEAYNDRGMSYFYLGKYEKALEDLEAAITHDPKLTMAYQRIGMTQMKLNNMPKAKEAYVKALELDSSDTFNILNFLELMIVDNDMSGLPTYVNKAYKSSRYTVEKIMSVFFDYVVKTINNQDTQKLEDEFSKLYKKSFTLQWDFSDLQKAIKASDYPSSAKSAILEKIQLLSDGRKNLVYK